MISGSERKELMWVLSQLLNKLGQGNSLELIEAFNKNTQEMDIVICMKHSENEKGIFIKPIARVFTFAPGDRPFEIYDRESVVMDDPEKDEVIEK